MTKATWLHSDWCSAASIGQEWDFAVGRGFVTWAFQKNEIGATGLRRPNVLVIHFSKFFHRAPRSKFVMI